MKVYRVRWSEKGEWKRPVVLDGAEAVAAFIDAKAKEEGQGFQVEYVGEKEG